MAFLSCLAETLPLKLLATTGLFKLRIALTSKSLAVFNGVEGVGSRKHSIKYG